MNPARIVGMSLSVNAKGGVPGARSGPGDFRMEIDWIKALRTQWAVMLFCVHCKIIVLAIKVALLHIIFCIFGFEGEYCVVNI